MRPRIGSLFSGYGGLTLAVEEVFGGETAWHCEIEPAPSKVLATRWPDVPNLGDITAVDWSQVEPVDILDGGSPCQDVSAAGKRAGMRAGTRSGLWASMRDAIEVIRPQIVVWENVRGVLSAEADSALEPCAGCVGDGDDGAVLRALGRVLGDLSDLGYDAGWYGLRAADVGAPHGRPRVFIVAYPAADASDFRHERRCPARDGWPGPTDSRGLAADAGSDGCDGDTELDGAAEGWVYGEHRGHADGRPDSPDWGPYTGAIRRWESVLGRTAPAPTELAPKGGQRLSPRFVEWMMGLPAGWVTDIPISRNDQLKALGNGVVPQQAAEALRRLLAHLATEAVA